MMPPSACELLDAARKSLDRTTVMAVAVSQYREMRKLAGPSRDLVDIERMFTDLGTTGLYHRKQFLGLLDPSRRLLQEAIIKYASERSARGDILLFYYSGHGAVDGTGQFCFCPSDALISADGRSHLAMSLIPFRDVVDTLAVQDVHPVFLIDACFSNSASAVPQLTSGVMNNQLQSASAGAYGLLCSSHNATASIDTPQGGAFTQAMCAIAAAGMADENRRRLPFMMLNDMGMRLREKLTLEGYPLSRLHIGPELPPVPLIRNTKYRPLRESFTPYLKRIVTYMSNNGQAREVTLADIDKHVGKGAYGNHSKLSLPPWSLVENGDAVKSRRLTKRGVRFAGRKLRIPRVIFKDFVTDQWKAEPGSQQVSIDDI